MADLRIGLAGWSYADWRGTYYPKDRPKEFSELRYSAELFDCLEINSSFYHTPKTSVCQGWAEVVADLDNFVFTAKLCRDVTHGRRSSSSGRLELLAPEEAERLAIEFREAVEPLASAGKLGAVLAQFPWYFEDTRKARELLESIARGLAPLEVVVEVRHNSFFVTGEDGVLPFLSRLGLNFANIDLPTSSTTPPLTTVNTGPLGYFRLHGRNRDAWFDKNAGRDDKYDYLYDANELAEIAPAMTRVANRTTTTYVITNNHYRGQAPANAIELMKILTGRVPDLPAPLLATYPALGELRAEAGS